MGGSRVLVVLVIVFAAIVVASASTFVVREQDHALRVQF